MWRVLVAGVDSASVSRAPSYIGASHTPPKQKSYTLITMSKRPAMSVLNILTTSLKGLIIKQYQAPVIRLARAESGTDNEE